MRRFFPSPFAKSFHKPRFIVTLPPRPFRVALMASLLAHLLVFYGLPISFGTTTKESSGLKARLRNIPPENPALRDSPPVSSILHPEEVSPAETLPAAPAFPLQQTGRIPAPDTDTAPFPESRPAPLASLPDPDAPEWKGGTGEKATASENDPAVDRDSLRRYVLALGIQARRFKNYPAQAKSRGESGTSTIDLEIGFGPPGATLAHSSGYPLLDEEAMTILRQAAAHTALPEALQGRRVRISVPVRFDSEGE